MESIKNAVLTYYTKQLDMTQNIGDYIQSLAASTFFDNIDIYIDRERLDEENINEKIKIILNGWFLCFPEHWPPSENIVPLIVSFHITPHTLSDVKIFTPKGIAYLKKHEPIGCRDYFTKKLLEKYNVASYFSGCLTLTLGRKYKSNKRTGNIYFVDPPLYIQTNLSKIKKLFTALFTLLVKPAMVKKVFRLHKSTGEGFIRSIFYASMWCYFYKKLFSDDIIRKAEFITHRIKSNDTKHLLNCAENLLEKYASAALVVTGRIHCALPCLGLETPVIFINSLQSDFRFGGLLDLLRVYEIDNGNFTTKDDYLKSIGKITDKTKITNKDDYLKYKMELERRCSEFVS